MPISDKPMAYKEFAAIKGQLVTELQLTPREWLQILGPNLDSTGSPQNLLNTSGQVVEASAASIALYQTYLMGASKAAMHPMIQAADITNTGGMDVTKYRMGAVALSEAGGSIAATVIVTGIASYKAVLDDLWIYAPAGTADAANTWTIASEAGGGITGPTTLAMVITASAVHHWSLGAVGASASPPMVCVNTTADKDITLAAVNLAIVGTTYYAIVMYHFEA